MNKRKIKKILNFLPSLYKQKQKTYCKKSTVPKLLLRKEQNNSIYLYSMLQKFCQFTT